MENKKEKYKKMKDKYKQVIVGINNSPRQELSKAVPLNQQKAKRKNTFDMGGAGLKHSNSPSPSNVNVSPKGRLSINERMNDMSKKQLSSKLFMPISPKTNINPKHKVKV